MCVCMCGCVSVFVFVCVYEWDVFVCVGNGWTGIVITLIHPILHQRGRGRNRKRDRNRLHIAYNEDREKRREGD